MPRTKPAPQDTKPDGSNLLERGIYRLEFMSRLLTGFAADGPNKLETTDVLELSEMLDEIVANLNAGHDAYADRVEALEDQLEARTAGGAR